MQNLWKGIPETRLQFAWLERKLCEVYEETERSLQGEKMNQSSEDRLKKLHPTLALKVRAMADALASHGIEIRVVQGLRTFEEQDRLFEQGRSRPGQIVTRARGGQSNHNFGLAADVCPFKDGKPDWNNNAAFMLIGAEAVKQGLAWGGNWRKFIDKPHVEIGNLTIKQCLALYRAGGLERVWSMVK